MVGLNIINIAKIFMVVLLFRKNLPKLLEFVALPVLPRQAIDEKKCKVIEENLCKLTKASYDFLMSYESLSICVIL